MKRIKYILYFLKNAWFVLLYKLFKRKKGCEKFLGKRGITVEYSDDLLLQKLLSNEPFMAVRYGAVELSCLNNWQKINLGFKKHYKDSVKKSMKNNAGFYPSEDRYLEQYCELMDMTMKDCDTLGISGIHMEDYFYKLQCNKATTIQYFAFEPIEKKWLQGLNNKRVLIVSPFKDEIEKQLQNRDKFDDLKNINAEFKVVKAVQSIGKEIPEFHNWFDALEAMKNEIKEQEFDVALVGAGAYGTPLCAYIKSLGKQAIQTGGATPLLFGIIGKRWENREYVKKHINEYWIKPKEKPLGYEDVEKGCYW